MDIKQLRYFLAIAEEGQILRAAKRLHMAQPPLSQQLKLLENELGIQLVERGSRKIQLTEAGRKLRDRAVQILELVEATAAELKEMNEGFEGTLSIGSVASLGTSILPEYVHSFNQSYPKVKFQLWEGDTYKITELIDSGIIEIGFVRFPFNSEIYECKYLPNEPIIAALSDHWLLEGDDRYVQLKEFAGKPIMLHRRHEAMVAEGCRAAGFEPNIICTTDDVRSILTWACANIGVALIPKSAVNFIPNMNLIYKEIVEPSFETRAAVIWSRNRHLSSAAKHFLDIFASKL